MPPTECAMCGYRGAEFRRRSDGEYVCPSCGEATGPVKQTVADVASKVTAAGITLAVLGGLTLLVGIGWLGFALFIMPPPVIPPDLPAAQHGGFMVGYRLAQITPPIITLLLGTMELAGGLSLTCRWSRGLGVAGAIAGMVPCTCTVLVGLPIGIWVLIVLNDPATKSLFR